MKTTLMATILAIFPAMADCEPSQSQPQAAVPSPPQVTVAKPVSKMIADQDEHVGRFVAVESVKVRVRVSGYLEAMHFRDGQLVKKGDLLFTIDRRPFQTTLAQASISEARTPLAFAETDLERGFALVAAAEPRPAAGSATESGNAAAMIAAQLRRQGVVCTAPRNAARDTDNSIPHETVWTLRCDEASYSATIWMRTARQSG
jgi:multidrug efflux pump subunit AcrA (membrane-fusion protein)